MNINSINNMNNLTSVDKSVHLSQPTGIKDVQGNKSDKPSFEDYLMNSLNEVNELQVEADRQSTLLAVGKAENVHDVTIAATKAKIALDLTMAVRGKVVESYKEIMRMQV